MKRGNTVELEMKKSLYTEGLADTKVFQCEIFRYDAKKECIYLVLKDGSLEEVSLDALYECRVDSGTGKFMCEGKIKERYRNEIGKILEFRIENGFYKINIKSVDK